MVVWLLGNGLKLLMNGFFLLGFGLLDKLLNRTF